MTDAVVSTEPLQFGVALWQGAGIRRQAELAALAEELGFDQVWFSNHKLYSDMFMGMTAGALATQTIQLGSFVAEPYTQHPALLAASIASLDELSRGRAMLGLGAGGANFRELGIEVRHPARAMAETIAIVRPLLRGETVDVTGSLFSAHNVWLHDLRPRPDLPIVVASRGDRVLQAAGEHADGAMIATYATPAGLAHGRSMVEQGRTRAGRTDPLRLLTRVDVTIDDDVAAARDAVRPMIAAMVMASYPDTGFLSHAGLEITPELAEMAVQKNEALAFGSGSLVPDSFVDQFAWVGTPEDIARRIAPVVDDGFRTIVVVLQPLRRDPADALTTFARQVIPRVRALVL